MTTDTKDYTPPAQFLPNLMASPKYIKLAPPQTHCFQYGLTKIIRPLVGQSPQHIKNTQQFLDYIHKVKLEPGEVITSYDVKALFTLVPVEQSTAIVK